MASLYEVRVDAVRNVGSGLIVGNVLRSRTDFPTLVVSSLSATAIKIKALVRGDHASALCEGDVMFFEWRESIQDQTFRFRPIVNITWNCHETTRCTL